MSETRRQFLKWGVLAAASSGLPACFSGTQPRNTSGALRFSATAINTAAACCGPRGWAAWEKKRALTIVNPSAAGPSLSITKALAGLAVCKTMADGWLDLAEPAANTISEWSSDPRKSRITIAMLLQQVSGLEAGVIPLYRAHPAHKGRTAIALRCVDPPGTVFRYGPAHWELLGEILRRKAMKHGQTLRKFMDRSVMHPMGLETAKWRADSTGAPYLSTGTELSITSLGKLGQTLLALLDGEDKNGFTAAAFQKVIRPSAVNPMFGGGLWSNRNASRTGASPIEIEKHIDDPAAPAFWQKACISRNHPAELFALVGSGGKRVYLWPSRRVVIARLGGSNSWRDQQFLQAIS